MSYNTQSPTISQRLLTLLISLFFLTSGLLKGVDPYGTSLKLQEYFAWWEMPSLSPYSTVCAVLLCGAEIALGYMLLFGLFRRTTLYPTYRLYGVWRRSDGARVWLLWRSLHP